MITEKKVIEGCLENNMKFQEIFFNMYSKKINTIIVRYCGENEKILVDVFREIFKNLKLIKQDKPTMDWLRVYVAEYCVHYLMYDTEITLTNQNLKNTPNLVNSSDLSAVEMIKLINQLPLIQKLIFNLYVVERLPHREISSLLGISISDSKKELTNARENLKKYLEILK